MAGYGLRPYNGLSGGYQSGGFNEFPMVNSEGDNIFAGDFMMWEDNGFVARLGGSTGISPTTTSDLTVTIGVAGGFRWVDSTGSPKWGNHYPGGTNTEVFAFVYDNPQQLFVIQADGVTATTVQADVGQNAPIINFASAAGNTSTGLSGVQLESSAAAVTATLALRIVGIVQDGTNENRSGTETSNVIVKIQQNVHAFGTGVVVAHGP
jgi:hypothetical protein